MYIVQLEDHSQDSVFKFPVPDLSTAEDALKGAMENWDTPGIKWQETSICRGEKEHWEATDQDEFVVYELSILDPR